MVTVWLELALQLMNCNSPYVPAAAALLLVTPTMPPPLEGVMAFPVPIVIAGAVVVLAVAKVPNPLICVEGIVGRSAATNERKAGFAALPVVGPANTRFAACVHSTMLIVPVAVIGEFVKVQYKGEVEVSFKPTLLTVPLPPPIGEPLTLKLPEILTSPTLVVPVAPPTFKAFGFGGIP